MGKLTCGICGKTICSEDGKITFCEHISNDYINQITYTKELFDIITKTDHETEPVEIKKPKENDDCVPKYDSVKYCDDIITYCSNLLRSKVTSTL